MHGARTLFGCGRRCRLRSRWALENGRVLDELLWVRRVVRRAVVLALRERCVVVGKRRRVALLRTLSDLLRLAAGLRRLWQLLRRLSVGLWQTRSTVRLLRGAREALDIVVSEDVPVTKPALSGVRVVVVL